MLALLNAYACHGSLQTDNQASGSAVCLPIWHSHSNTHLLEQVHMLCLIVNLQLSVQAAAVRDALAPVLGLSASLHPGKPTTSKEAQSSASSAQHGALYTLRRVGKLWWSCLAPGVALEASKQLLDDLAGTLVHDILARKVRYKDQTSLAAAWYVAYLTCG